jgi:hypothetical protein
MIEPVADLLGIPVHRVFANTLLFDPADGSYAGFDASEPTSRDGGKPRVLAQLAHAHGYGPIGECRFPSFRAYLTDVYVRTSYQRCRKST